MAVRHEPRRRVDAPIAGAASPTFSRVESKVRELLDEANNLRSQPVAPSVLKLLKRALVVLAYYIDRRQPITSVEALRNHVAGYAYPQPPLGRVPGRKIGNDTIRQLLCDPVAAELVDAAIRLGWLHGDFHTPTALTVFADVVDAGKDSHALAVSNGMLPIMGIGTGSFDSFVLNAVLELVLGTHHDPATEHGPDELARIVRQAGYDTVEEMPLLHFDQAFAQLIAHDADVRDRFKGAVSEQEHKRAFPPDAVVQRMPHAPYKRRLRTPAGEIMSREHPEMAEVLTRFGYRGVLAYHEECCSSSAISADLARVSDLDDPDVTQLTRGELEEFQEKRSITVDVWNVDHYVLTGQDRDGVLRRRVARHASFDDRITIFDTVGFNDETMQEAVVLAEYATANELRKSCIAASLNERIKPGLLAASSPPVRAGMRRWAMLANAVTVAMTRRAQAERLGG